LAPSVVVIGLLIIAVAGNVASGLDQAARSGRPAELFALVVDEITSGLIWLLLVPVIVRIFRRATPPRIPVPAIPAVHAFAIPIISLIHFVLTRALRIVIYATHGEGYIFRFRWTDFIADLYKDVLTYLLLGLIYIGTEYLLAVRAKSASVPPLKACLAPLIDVRDGTQTLYVPAGDILWAEAAGNYVELHIASGRALLMRTTLAGLARRLDGAGFLRIHRSRLVNPAAIAACENLPAGDALLYLTNGAKISVSRTYRATLSQVMTARIMDLPVEERH
jgi:DNA-binding LytR/AlgR family response regulator